MSIIKPWNWFPRDITHLQLLGEFKSRLGWRCWLAQSKLDAADKSPGTHHWHSGSPDRLSPGFWQLLGQLQTQLLSVHLPMSQLLSQGQVGEAPRTLVSKPPCCFAWRVQRHLRGTGNKLEAAQAAPWVSHTAAGFSVLCLFIWGRSSACSGAGPLAPAFSPQ